MIPKYEHRDLLIGSISILLFLGCKFAYSIVSTDSIGFLLKPTSYLVGMFLGEVVQYESGQGYLFPKLNILIDKSCSGFNWWMLAFLVGIFSILKYLPNQQKHALFIPMVLLLAYVATVLVNTTRILIAAWIEPHLFDYLPSFHLLEGILIYLSCLMLWHLLCIQLIKLLQTTKSYSTV